MGLNVNHVCPVSVDIIYTSSVKETRCNNQDIISLQTAFFVSEELLLIDNCTNHCYE